MKSLRFDASDAQCYSQMVVSATSSQDLGSLRNTLEGSSVSSLHVRKCTFVSMRASMFLCMQVHMFVCLQVSDHAFVYVNLCFSACRHARVSSWMGYFVDICMDVAVYTCI